MSELTENNPRPKVFRFERLRQRRVMHGMRIQYSRTINASYGTVIDHYELSAPGYLDNNEKVAE